jgi:xylono-1,5-lactonase
MNGARQAVAHRWSVIGDTRTELGEGPLWSPRRGSLFWVDILGHTLHEWTPGGSEIRRYPMPDLIAWIIECESEGRFIIGLGSGFAELQLQPRQLRPLICPEPTRAPMRVNDAKASARGSIFAGTMALAADAPIGSLYRLDPRGELCVVDTGYTIPNGPAFSSNGRLLYHTDSARGLIFRFPLHDDGSLGARSVFLEFSAAWGKPDGMTVDAEDNLWVAHWGGSCVSRFSPAGKRIDTVGLPTPQITSCAFGGPELNRLLVTSAAIGRSEDPLAGALFEIEVGVHGLAPHRFSR